MKTKIYDIWNGKARKQIIKGIKAINCIGIEYVFESFDEFKAWCKEQEFDQYDFTLKPFDNTDYKESEY